MLAPDLARSMTGGGIRDWLFSRQSICEIPVRLQDKDDAEDGLADARLQECEQNASPQQGRTGANLVTSWMRRPIAVAKTIKSRA
ncbi:hypothetical protein LQ948_16110 [Jiella sp. MQZ9-1]|uniref:Uncharacterized protein n=1 Tax=Jiella flava TaxID=2816857 RepID=A0A939JX30_9HYPH|nr:hypothetical protein [Jiella flava]MBO0664159.1 hypothetical protein [Jiella flava]MCD2472731.1 hypothetical protein [Jiella flava]